VVETLGWRVSPREILRDVSGERAKICIYPGKYVKAEELDKQIAGLIQGLVIPDTWQVEVTDIPSSMDERAWIATEKKRIEEKLRRLRLLFAESEINEGQYELERRKLGIFCLSGGSKRG